MMPDDRKRASVPPLGARFHDALSYAFEAHRTQARKGGSIPYFGHLMGVSAIVIEAGGDEDQAIAALLHDVLEDQPDTVTPHDVESRFGSEVLRIVEACSDRAPEGEERGPDNWQQRKERYLTHLRETDDRVRLVSLADKLYNARTILADLEQHGTRLWSRFNVGREQTLWYYRSLADVFRATVSHAQYRWLVQELDRTVTAMEGWTAPSLQLETIDEALAQR